MRGARHLPGIAAGLALAAVAWVAAGPALARGVTETERASLAATVRAYEAAMHGGEGARVVDVVPPRLVAEIAAEHGTSADALRSTLAAQVDGLKAKGIRETITMDVAGARYRELSDGEPYALIPSHVVVDGPTHVDSRFQTLGMLDGGRWHLVDVSRPERVAIFIKAFPAFAGVDFGVKVLETKP